MGSRRVRHCGEADHLGLFVSNARVNSARSFHLPARYFGIHRLTAGGSVVAISVPDSSRDDLGLWCGSRNYGVFLAAVRF